MLAKKTVCQKIVKLLDDNEKLRKSPKERRETNSVVLKEKLYEKDLSKTFPLWTKNAESEIQNAEDIAFLKSMKSDHVASYSCFDKISQAFKKKKRC